MKPHLVRVRADTEDEGSHCFRWRTGDLTFTPDVLQTGRKPILLHCFAVCLHRLHGNPFLPPDVIYFSVFFKSGPYLSRCCHNLPVSAASVPHVNSLRQFQPQNKTSPLMQGSQSVWNVTPSSILAASQPFDFSLNSNFHVSLGFFFTLKYKHEVLSVAAAQLDAFQINSALSFFLKIPQSAFETSVKWHALLRRCCLTGNAF